LPPARNHLVSKHRGFVGHQRVCPSQPTIHAVHNTVSGTHKYEFEQGIVLAVTKIIPVVSTSAWPIHWISFTPLLSPRISSTACGFCLPQDLPPDLSSRPAGPVVGCEMLRRRVLKSNRNLGHQRQHHAKPVQRSHNHKTEMSR